MGWRCFFVRKQLALLVGDDLPDRPKRAVKAHLDACPTCRRHLAVLKGSRAAMLQGVAEHSAGGASLWPAIRSRLEHTSDQRPAQQSWLPIGSLAVASVALAVMLWEQSIGSTMLRPISTERIAPSTGQLVSGQTSEVNGQSSESPWLAEWRSEGAGGRSDFLLEPALPVGYSTREF
jgi:anti-sigma factor RsiW